MGRANKWVGGGRLGDSASGGSKVNGGNTGIYNEHQDSGAKVTGNANVKISDRFSPGDEMGTRAISTHNDINTFLKGAKSRGPYGGPSFASMNNMEHNYKMGTPSSKFPTPSGGSSPSGGRRGGTTKGSISAGHGTGSGRGGLGRA